MGARPRTRSAPTSSSTASTAAASCASTTRPTRSTRRRCWRRSSGSCPGDDPRLRASVLAIADELTEHGFVLRYKTDETDDGLSGKEGTFLICSFWLVSALAIIGELQRARDLMERLLRVASPLGLYAEEFDADTGRHLGNFPQAFSHLALIEAAARIILAERTGGAAHDAADYDVIVIGSGAGGGTLVRHLAPSGKRILLLERGDWLPREPQNWDAQHGVRRQPLRVARTPGTTRDGKPFQPQVHYFVGGATKLYGAALYRLRAEDFGELRHHDGISPAWPIGYDEMEPYYTQAEQLYQVHGARGEDPTEPPASAPYPFPAVSPRAAHPAARRRPRGGRPPPVPRALRRDARRARTCRTARACAAPTCDGFPCLVHAKSDAEVLGVRPALEHPNVTLLHERRGRARWRPTPRGTRGHRRRGRPRRRARDLRGRHRRRLLRRGEQRQAAARLGQRRAPARAGQRLRPGRAQLHVPQQPGRAGALQGAEPDRLPEDARAQRLLLRRATTSSTRWATSRWSASRRPRCTAARSRSQTKLAPQRTLDDGRRARGRLLALDRGPAAAGEPRHAATATAASRLAYTPTNEEPEEAALPRAQVDARRTSGCTTTTCSRGTRTSRTTSRSPGCAHQAGTCRFGTDPATSVLERRLPRARGRQPLRRRHELLPEHRRGQPGAHRDGERAARRATTCSSGWARRQAQREPARVA